MKTITLKPGRDALTLSAPIAEAVRKEARRRHTTAEAFIRSMLEDSADIRAADAALKKHKAGGSKTVSLAEMKKSLGLAS